MAEVATTMARSTLEELLESIKSKDEKSKDVPPALPKRPTSRARLPSSVRLRKTVGLAADGLMSARPTNGRTYVTFESAIVDQKPALNLAVEVKGLSEHGVQVARGPDYAAWDPWDGDALTRADLLTTPASPVSEDTPALPTSHLVSVESFAKSWPLSSPARLPGVVADSDSAFCLDAIDAVNPAPSTRPDASVLSIPAVINVEPPSVSSPTFISAKNDEQERQEVQQSDCTSSDVFALTTPPKSPLSRDASPVSADTGFCFPMTPFSAGLAPPESQAHSLSIATSRTLSRKWKEEGVHGLKKVRFKHHCAQE